jgi:hypothetical protein
MLSLLLLKAMGSFDEFIKVDDRPRFRKWIFFLVYVTRKPALCCAASMNVT